MRSLFLLAIFALLPGLIAGCTDRNSGPAPHIDLELSKEARRIDVTVDGRMFTSYLFDDADPILRKPTLHPVVSAAGTIVTRGFPLDPKPGERADHPHQVGVWMNHGDVNNLDFWNNSGARPAEQASQYGTISHREILETRGGDSTGTLVVTCNWLRPNGSVLLREETKFVFAADADGRSIDRITTWTALDDLVVFEDSKEGMFGIRVAGELEHPSDVRDPFVNPDGSLSEPTVDSSYATGHYLNSEGLEGYDVWGRRARWTALSGSVDGDPVTLAIFDHPANPGYPTHWMARGYGLFAANPLGRRVYTEEADSLDFTLAPEESITFRYRLLIRDGPPPSADWLNTRHELFATDHE